MVDEEGLIRCVGRLGAAHNMSYGATVGAIAANSNLIKLKKNNNVIPVLNSSYVHCDFSNWFIDYLKMLMNLNSLFVVVDI